MMLMAGYCSHGDSRQIGASVTLRRFAAFCHINRGARGAIKLVLKVVFLRLSLLTLSRNM